MVTEIWKDIIDFPNYQISNLGRVKSKERIVNALYNSKKRNRERILKLFTNNRGYKVVTLYNHNGKSNPIFVHRLVAKSFINNPNKHNIINHINADKGDNRVDNLEWCTQSHNIKEAYRLGNAKPQLTNLGKFGKNNKKAQKIKQIDIETNEVINYFYGTLEAERITGVNFRNIHLCLKNKIKSAGGYKWEKVERQLERIANE